MAAEADPLQALIAHAVAAHQAGRLAEAEAGYRAALARHPASVDLHYNLGLVLQATQRLHEAEACYRQTLKLQPAHASAWNNLGNLLRDTRRFDEAVAAFEHALALQPAHRHARFNLSLALLAQGRHAEAWPLYESRLTAFDAMLPPLACPRWQGEPLAGRRLLVVCEQGIGDAVMFIRFVPRLRALGVARVTVLCRPELSALLATCEGVDETAPRDDGTHDLHVPLMSLALHLQAGPRDGAAIPYLRALPDRLAMWRPVLTPGLRHVGVAWRGSAGHSNDAQRSTSLAALRPLWQLPGVQFVSLQKGTGEDEARQPPAGQPLLHVGSALRDVADLAAVIALMDAVVTVDTAVAHVAGALGQPCWVMPAAVACDWRWLDGGMPGESAWYPGTTRVVLRPVGADWDVAVRQVVQASAAG